jgi:antitoxin FitA
MGALDVPDVPDELRTRLMVQAAARGQTLAEYLRDQLTALAEGGSGTELLDRFEGRADGSHLTDEEHDEEIERLRIERGGQC